MYSSLNDSIVAQESFAEDVRTDIQHAKPKHPYQVLRMLPDNATPEQQDSAIQANFKPKSVRVNTRVDTLTVFGLKYNKKENITEMRYDKESPFADDPRYNPELGVSQKGTAGDPIPYNVSSDDIITGMLIACFILAVTSLANSMKFVVKQAKNFFYVQRNGTTTITETTSEVRFQLFLVLQTCLLFSIIFFFYTLNNVADTFLLPTQYHLLAVFFGVFASYFMLRALAYHVVNWVFFDKKKNAQFSKSLLFLTSMEGILLFPLVMLQVYFDLSVNSAVIYTAIVVVLFKLLTLYKSYIIFFRRTSVFLQIFLYFCALEIIPMLSLLGVLVLITDYLKINY